MNKKISVIIPVYGTEKYLEKCLQSVLNQTYSNLEIIVVNDASPDNSQAIIDQYASRYDNIKSIVLKENKGLYHARLAGYDCATGDYIAFLDSDDYVGLDAYRVLIFKAESTKSDIVFGNIVIEWESDGRLETHIYNEPKFDTLQGTDIIKCFLEQEGYTFYWYAVWNKIYSRNIFEKARNYFDRITQHTIMAEDVAFCSVLFAMADKITHIDYYTNYYLQSEISSTCRSRDLEKYIKNIKDLCRVMNFVQDFVYEHPRYALYKDKFKRFKEVFILYWGTNIQGALFSSRKKKKCINILKKEAGILELPDHSREGIRSLTYNVDRSFIYCQSAEFNGKYEQIIEQIKTNEVRALVLPFHNVLFQANYIEFTDFFELLELAYNHVSSNIQSKKWAELRQSCEEDLNKSKSMKLSIEDIYEKMCEAGLDGKICKKLKKAEKELIESIYTPRNSIKQLYELAKYLNKTIIILTGRVFDESLVNDILNKYGYPKYSNIVYKNILSTEDISEELDISPESIIQIVSDAIKSENHYNKRIKRINYPKSLSVLQNKCDYFKYINNSRTVKESFFSNLLNKLSIVTVANIYFDNPFRSFSDQTDFNKDVYFLGLFPIALYSLIISKWLSSGNNSEIIFNNDDFSMFKYFFERYSKAEIQTRKDNLLSHNTKTLFKFASSDEPNINKHEPLAVDNCVSLFCNTAIEDEQCDTLHLFGNKPTMEIVRYILGNINPHVEKFYSETLINYTIKKGALDFEESFLKIFGNYIDDLSVDYNSMTYPFKYLLNQSSYEDISVFDYCSLYHKEIKGYREKSLFVHWVELGKKDGWLERGGEGLGYYPFLYGKSDFTKTIFLLAFDKQTLFKKLQTRLSWNKYVYKIVQLYKKLCIKEKGNV